MQGLQKIRIWLTIWIAYKRPFSKPAFTTPLATEFNEIEAMDIKVFKIIYILHHIDHVTRFSAAAIVKSKEKEEIIKNIFKIWISIYVPPSRYYIGNGGEFTNETCNEMCEV